MMESNGRGSFNYILLQKAKNSFLSGNGYGHPNANNEDGGWENPYLHVGKGAFMGTEDPYCTRLLADDYPDINFYICQLHLMRGKSP